ncbi:MAG: CDP-alcohol phosphatidyltransferase family protein [Clostridia bacterium]
MFKKEYMTIPNFLSMSRIVFLPVLFILIWLEMNLAFTIAYAILGSTDLFDGVVARKLHQTSEIGKALDSIADLFFYLSTAYFIYALYPQYMQPNMTFLYVFLGLLVFSFLVSAVRCKKPILMHTFILKLCAVFVYFLVILSYFLDTTGFIAFILFTYYIGFIEEIIIFIRYGEVDPDTPTLFHLIWAKRE